MNCKKNTICSNSPLYNIHYSELEHMMFVRTGIGLMGACLNLSENCFNLLKSFRLKIFYTIPNYSSVFGHPY